MDTSYSLFASRGIRLFSLSALTLLVKHVVWFLRRREITFVSQLPHCSSSLRVSAVARIFLKRFSRPPGLFLREMYAVLYASMRLLRDRRRRLVRGFLMPAVRACECGGAAAHHTSAMIAFELVRSSLWCEHT